MTDESFCNALSPNGTLKTLALALPLPNLADAQISPPTPSAFKLVSVDALCCAAFVYLGSALLWALVACGSCEYGLRY